MILRKLTWSLVTCHQQRRPEYISFRITRFTDILLLYSVHCHAFTNDISKMYRQVKVSPCHRRYQHILWRSSSDEAIQSCELNTVTYKVNYAPNLTTQVLHCIAEQDSRESPLVREALLYCTTVYDCYYVR